MPKRLVMLAIGPGKTIVSCSVFTVVFYRITSNVVRSVTLLFSYRSELFETEGLIVPVAELVAEFDFCSSFVESLSFCSVTRFTNLLVSEATIVSPVCSNSEKNPVLFLSGDVFYITSFTIKYFHCPFLRKVVKSHLFMLN